MHRMIAREPQFYFAAFFRSAHRRFIASAMRFRPSGEMPPFFATVPVLAAFLLPLGRPRFFGAGATGTPERAERICWRRSISASSSETIRFTSIATTFQVGGAPHRLASILPESDQEQAIKGPRSLLPSFLTVLPGRYRSYIEGMIPLESCNGIQDSGALHRSSYSYAPAKILREPVSVPLARMLFRSWLLSMQ